MNNLKKMITLYALCAASLAAKAEKIAEGEFMPVQQSGEIEGFRDGLVNGHLMVKSTGTIDGVKTPYMFLNTNTVDFAKSGFTFKEMNDVNSLAVVQENNKDVIYATRNSDTNNVYKFHVDSAEALSGVKGIEKISAKNVKKFTIINGEVVAVANNKLYNLSQGTSVSFRPGTTDSVVDKNGTEYTIGAFDGKGFSYQKSGDTVKSPVISVAEEIQRWFYDKKTNTIYYWAKENDGSMTLFDLNLDNNNITTHRLQKNTDTKAIAILPSGELVFKTTSGALNMNGQELPFVSQPEYVNSLTSGSLVYKVGKKSADARKTMLSVSKIEQR